MKLFEEIKIWEHKESGDAVCYRCLHVIPDGGYYVQSADFYSPDNTAPFDFEKQFVELFCQTLSDDLFATYPTIQMAIAEFKNEFAVLA